jgi:dipeptidyl aminopeptidase/acylaminoacyl peptidase
MEPTFGPISFAVEVNEDNQPVSPASLFPADTQEIHAVFDYEGMSDTDVWERRWYQAGVEVSSGSGTWEAGERGTFDLSLTAGGQPLGGGSWTLELYVNGELAQTGTFSIEASPTATPPPAAATYRLAFARWDGGKHDLYIANTDGGGERFILERAAGPSWSRDGRALYVYGEEGVDQQVRDGVTYTWPDAGISNGVLLLDLTTQSEGGLPGAFQHSSWKEGTARAVALAPSGTMLAYDATHGSPDRRIYFLGTDENQQFSIEIPGEQPSWSPDSSQVAYRSGRDNKTAIWISSRDDSVHYSITNEGSDAFPAWSPDGQSIAFHRDPGGNVDIYIANADGSNVRRLTDAPGPDTLPTWTPDGRIVFRSARSGSWGIYIMNGDGSGQKQIIANADPGPDWTFGKMDVY